MKRETFEQIDNKILEKVKEFKSSLNENEHIAWEGIPQMKLLINSNSLETLMPMFFAVLCGFGCLFSFVCWLKYPYIIVLIVSLFLGFLAVFLTIAFFSTIYKLSYAKKIVPRYILTNQRIVVIDYNQNAIMMELYLQKLVTIEKLKQSFGVGSISVTDNNFKKLSWLSIKEFEYIYSAIYPIVMDNRKKLGLNNLGDQETNYKKCEYCGLDYPDYNYCCPHCKAKNKSVNNKK